MKERAYYSELSGEHKLLSEVESLSLSFSCLNSFLPANTVHLPRLEVGAALINEYCIALLQVFLCDPVHLTRSSLR